jgi:extradiol dioxygenase family protein
MPEEIKFAHELEKALGEENLRNFKRNLMGICGKNTIKTSEEITIILLKMGVCKTVKEAKKLAEDLNDKHVTYREKIRLSFYSELHDKKTLYFKATEENRYKTYYLTKHHLIKDLNDEE